MVTNAEDIDDRGAERLAAAIMVRAINDYKELATGKVNTLQCNAFELNKFFESGCDRYLDKHTGKELKATLQEKYGDLPDYRPPKTDTYKPKARGTERQIKSRMRRVNV